jgi:parallel beta-helix repeat protein
MLCYKNCIRNKKITRFVKITLIIITAFFQVSLLAQPCTMYMVSSLQNSALLESNSPLPTQAQTSSSLEYTDINEALLNSTSGEVICFKTGLYSAIRIENIQGGLNNITLKAETDAEIEIINNSYSGTGIVIRNSKKIIISGFSISGGLYGIYAIGSSDLTLVNNTIFNVGQEGIIVKSGIASQSLSNFVIANNVISDTGKGLSQYGEGIYVGDGNDNFNEIINHVKIENNTITNAMNEAIDIKINAKNVIIHANTITNTNLKFNGAITVATSDRYGEDSNITISHNTIEGVINRSGYRAIGIAVGQGNALINDNNIIEEGTKFVGICLFSTFVNEKANTVILRGNKVVTNGIAILKNCGHGGTGGTGANALAHVVDINP